MAHVMVFFPYVVLIAYLLIRFSLVILDLYEAIMNLGISEAAFMNRDVHVLRTSTYTQIDTRPGQHSLETSFSPLSCHFTSNIWMRPGSSAVMLKIKVIPLVYCCVSGV